MFDAGVFAQEILAPAHQTTSNWLQGVVTELSELEKDIEATLAALEQETDHRRAAALVGDLAAFLSVRKASIMSNVRSGSGQSIYMAVELDAALWSAINGTLAAAKALQRK